MYNLPCSLQYMDISHNYISSIPASLPNLLELNASFNQLSHNILYLPDSLEKIDISNNMITYISFLPKNIKSLDVSQNLLKYCTYKDIPESLQMADLRGNKYLSSHCVEYLSKDKRFFLDQVDDKNSTCGRKLNDSPTNANWIWDDDGYSYNRNGFDYAKQTRSHYQSYSHGSTYNTYNNYSKYVKTNPHFISLEKKVKL